ncbi:MAG: hypothetical protein ACM3SY_19820 [Candidatus Omnitrophota bacterium]
MIDELENAIHYQLLKDFTWFLWQLSEEFNTQLFITSHSKECIDSFFNSGIPTEAISAYRLKKEGDGVKSDYISGDKLARLIELMDVDLRGEE